MSVDTQYVLVKPFTRKLFTKAEATGVFLTVEADALRTFMESHNWRPTKAVGLYLCASPVEAKRILAEAEGLKWAPFSFLVQTREVYDQIKPILQKYAIVHTYVDRGRAW